MRTSNPALSEAALARVVPEEHLRDGWAAPGGVPPAPDEVSPWPPALAVTDRMTVGGTVSATAVLLVVLVATGFLGWNAVEVGPVGAELPGWAFAALIGGLVVGLATIFRPQWARLTAPLYAALEGLVVGAISAAYESEFDGIVLKAAALTVGVLAVMLLGHAVRAIRVTSRFRLGVFMATGAVALVYAFDCLLRLFGADIAFIHETGTIGILVSLAVVVIAALNLVLDFDFVEQAVEAGAPRSTEWYAAFGLLVTLVWLYLELLRLLAKLQSRD